MTRARSMTLVAMARPVRGQSGFKGVRWRPDKQRWAAAITIKGKAKHLGYFKDPKLASETHDAVEKAARLLL